MTPENFLLITTEAVDYIHYPDHTDIEYSGGTQLFYRKAVAEMINYPDLSKIFVWISPPRKTEVHIYPLENYGFGENGSTVDPSLLSEQLGSLDNPIVMISTTLRTDFDLDLLRIYAEKINFLFIDLQGFIRNGRKHEFFMIPEWVLNLPKVVFKAGEEEMPYIDLQMILKNENSVVLYTKGDKGFTVMQGERSFDIAPSEIIKRVNMEYRGAGDTLFFHFALQYIQNEDLASASTFAEKAVIDFLKKKDK